MFDKVKNVLFYIAPFYDSIGYLLMLTTLFISFI